MNNKVILISFCNKLIQDAYSDNFNINTIPSKHRIAYQRCIDIVRQNNINYTQLFFRLSNSQLDSSNLKRSMIYNIY